MRVIYVVAAIILGTALPAPTQGEERQAGERRATKQAAKKPAPKLRKGAVMSPYNPDTYTIDDLCGPFSDLIWGCEKKKR